MQHLSDADLQSLMNAIALRQGKPSELAKQYKTTVDALRAFVVEHHDELTIIREEYEASQGESTGDLTPAQLSDLWITNKFDRLQRYQAVADQLYNEVTGPNHIVGSEYATALRELRSYMQSVANELGQLLHRGSGESDSDSLSVDIQGIDINTLR